MTDSISDMLTRIRNAQAVFKETVIIPFSNLKYNIAEIMSREGFIGFVKKKKKKGKKYIEIYLKYHIDKDTGKKIKPFISGLKRVSKPGRRIYVSYKKIKPTRGKYGISIISTSAGLMIDKSAREKKRGGEIICEIW